MRNRPQRRRARGAWRLVGASLAGAAAAETSDAADLTAVDVRELRASVRDMFVHAYEGYMTHAFPHDELKPLSRTFVDSLVELGNVERPTREHYRGVALTLIDALDTLAVVGNASEFARQVAWVSEHVSFDQDADVSLFETNIRVLGGLLSAHLLAAGETPGGSGLAVADYDGALLRLATDLGDRLLSAFSADCTRLPRAFVNLRGKRPRYAAHEQCTAGSGTLLLEFGLLSRLTGDPRYENAALCALRLLWSKRSSLGLLGNSLDADSGTWRNPLAGIGAGVDSFYEYLLKSYIVFDRPELYEMWNTSYSAVLKHLRRGAWYGETNMNHGHADVTVVDSLSAFWPGLQVLVGDIGMAADTHAAFHSLWLRLGVLPERYDVRRESVVDRPWADVYPLRPELAESCYFLFRATGDRKYQQMGAEMVRSLNAYARTPAGFASISSVRELRQDDHMSSFFLAETLKYLYLLFDEDNFVNTHGGSIIFTTEGHLVPLLPKLNQPAHAVPAAGGGAAPNLLAGEGSLFSRRFGSGANQPLRTLSVKQMRSLIALADLSSDDCIEMDDLLGRAETAEALLRERAVSELICPALPTAFTSSASRGIRFL